MVLVPRRDFGRPAGAGPSHGTVFSVAIFSLEPVLATEAMVRSIVERGRLTHGWNNAEHIG
jgi:hypothetical protein